MDSSAGWNPEKANEGNMAGRNGILHVGAKHLQVKVSHNSLILTANALPLL